MFEEIIHTVMAFDGFVTTAILIVFGCIDLGIGENQPKDIAFLCIGCAVCDTIALIFSVLAGMAYDAIMLALFVYLLWSLALAFYTGTNMVTQGHLTMVIGVIFILLGTIGCTRLGDILTGVAAGILGIYLCLFALVFYFGERVRIVEKTAGILAFVDGFLWFLMSYNLLMASLQNAL